MAGPGVVVAACENGPTREPVCTPGHHLGEDSGGRCSVCNTRLTPRDLTRVGLLLVALSALIVAAIIALAIWWAIG